eukprot:3381273-Pleurochrysis_carterae.AAC.4
MEKRSSLRLNFSRGARACAIESRDLVDVDCDAFVFVGRVGHVDGDALQQHGPGRADAPC